LVLGLHAYAHCGWIQQFDHQVPVLVAYVAFSLALGVSAGLFCGRTLQSMVITFIGYVGVRGWIEGSRQKASGSSSGISAPRRPRHSSFVSETVLLLIEFQRVSEPSYQDCLETSARRTTGCRSRFRHDAAR